VITVSFCCDDDYGSLTGKAIRVDFQKYELSVVDTLWPPAGVTLSFQLADNQVVPPIKAAVKIGRDIWREIYGRGSGGNIFWSSVLVRGVDAIAMMNYLMKLKWWRAESGECYLFDQFNAKRPIDPKAFFESRKRETSAQIR
jgi:hypothetical protein